MFELVLHKTAAKKLAKLPRQIRDKIARSMEILLVNPFLGKKLHGELAGCRRLRVGDFRIVYDVYEFSSTVVVHAIGSRGDVYK